jgi:hypothetical protein
VSPTRQRLHTGLCVQQARLTFAASVMTSHPSALRTLDSAGTGSRTHPALVTANPTLSGPQLARGTHRFSDQPSIVPALAKNLS